MTQRISSEDKRAIAELVIEEIVNYRSGKAKQMSSNVQIAQLIGVCSRAASQFLKQYISPEDLDFRARTLQSQSALRKNQMYESEFNHLSDEERSRIGRLGYAARKEKGGMSSEQLSEQARRRNLVYGSPSKNMTFEERSAAGKAGGRIAGEKCAREKIGFCGMSPEEKADIARRTFHLTGLAHLTPEERYENGVKGYSTGLAKIPKEIMREVRRKTGKIWGKVNGAKSAQAHRKNAYHVENRFYASSQQEGVVALLLEKYVPDYQVREGETVQVRNRGINNGGIDFLVDGEFLEWHPVAFYNGKRGDIPSAKEIKSYKQVLSQIPEAELEDFVRDYKQVLALNYRSSRQEAVDNSGYMGANVSLATNVQELYDFISQHGGNLPAFDDFKREFNQKVKYVKGFKVNKDSLVEAV